MAKAKSKQQKTVETMLTDPSIPDAMKRQILAQLLGSEEEEAQEILGRVLEAATRASAGEQLQAKTEELAELILQMQKSPLRCANFDRMVDVPGVGPRAHVVLYDGGTASCIVPDAKLTARLRCGDTVWLDAGAGTLLFHQPDETATGEEARLERWLPDGNVEVSQGELGRFVCRPSAGLVDQRNAGEAEPGCTLLASPRRLLAFRALPPEQGVGGLRHLSRDPLPDVVLERDVGAPQPFIREFARHVEREMLDPALSRRYRLRRSRLLLATGVPGSGKTLSIHALWRLLYEVMSRVTGAAIDALPQRVMQLRAPEMLDKYVGSSDRNLQRFFDELDQLAVEPFFGPDGRRWDLPVLVVAEEIDALARQRGEDAIYDRIQTTLLTGLDPARSVFRDRLVIAICTSNVPGTLDAAFRRRAGGSVVQFGRLDRFGFQAVLSRRLRELPFAAGTREAAALRREVATSLATWLFAPNGEAGSGGRGLVELTFVGQPEVHVKHRRDFLTAGLVDAAVQQACQQACDAEWAGAAEPGLSGELLMCALDDQVRHIVDQLTPRNCIQYLTLPDATRVASVRRIPQPPVLPARLERAS